MFAVVTTVELPESATIEEGRKQLEAVAARSTNGVPWTYFYNSVDDNSSAAMEQ